MHRDSAFLPQRRSRFTISPVRVAILLRGINLGATNRVPMPALREALTEAGLRDVATHVQSGNIVAEPDGAAASQDQLAALVERLVADRFGVGSPAIVRSAAELRAVVERNPFVEPAAEHPKQYQVSFCSAPLAAPALAQLSALRAEGAAVAASDSGREVYAWHQGGIHRSRLATAISDRRLGVTATARNWTTVTTLLQLAEDPGDEA